MKKNTKNLNLKRGISLIVLVITIIVIVILAVAVILSIANNNPIENAKNAVTENEKATLKEAANLEYTTMYANAKINGEEIDYAKMTKDIQKNLNEQGFSKDEVKKVKATKDGIEIKERYTLKYSSEEVSVNYECSFLGVEDRSKITKIIFEDDILGAPENATDLSEEENGSILGWLDGSEVHIASDGIICAPKDASYMFASLNSCLEIQNLNLLDTSNVTDMSSMFAYCENLTSLDLSSFDTSNVTDMLGMFNACRNLTSLDLSNFDTSNVTDMTQMFYNCTGLTSLDLSNFNTSNVTSMNTMFDSCRNLTSLDLSNFNTSNVTNMLSMFCECVNLIQLDLSSFDTSNVIYAFEMFAYCRKLERIYGSEKFETSSFQIHYEMFNECDALVGGAGTVYDANYMDKTYARIDGGPDSATPGYFTLKQ